MGVTLAWAGSTHSRAASVRSRAGFMVSVSVGGGAAASSCVLLSGGGGGGGGEIGDCAGPFYMLHPSPSPPPVLLLLFLHLSQRWANYGPRVRVLFNLLSQSDRCSQ